jgi:hypothetical protein
VLRQQVTAAATAVAAAAAAAAFTVAVLDHVTLQCRPGCQQQAAIAAEAAAAYGISGSADVCALCNYKSMMQLQAATLASTHATAERLNTYQANQNHQPASSTSRAHLPLPLCCAPHLLSYPLCAVEHIDSGA